jgi:DNA-binding PadR family transcriptional regulator
MVSFFGVGFAARRLGMKMKEYAMLAALAHGPRSGYDLNRWFDEAASHFCTAGYSSVYPALNRFEREGLVVYETVPSDRGPERKVYSLTGEGREVLLEWAAEPASGPEVRDEQLVKALAYGLLPAERAPGEGRDFRGGIPWDEAHPDARRRSRGELYKVVQGRHVLRSGRSSPDVGRPQVGAEGTRADLFLATAHPRAVIEAPPVNRTILH